MPDPGGRYQEAEQVGDRLAHFRHVERISYMRFDKADERTLDDRPSLADEVDVNDSSADVCRCG